MDRCINHDWLTRDDKSVCMSCGAELDRPPIQYSKLHSSGARQRVAPKRSVPEVIIHRPWRAG